MGGLAGHMSHLYDNPSLKFSQMKDIFVKAATGELVGTEKTDGQNLFLSYSVKDGVAKAARNKGNIKTGGMSARELASKFADRGNLTKAFVEAFKAWEDVASSMPYEQQIDIFGPDANIFYNAEIQDPRNANVINYDTKNLVIHRTGHAKFDKMTGNVTDIDVRDNWEKLNSYLRDGVSGGEDYSVLGNALVKLKALDDGEILKRAVSNLEAVIDEVGLSDNNNIGEYIVARLDSMLSNTGFSEETKKEVIRRILKTKDSSLRTVYKTIPAENVEQRELAKNIINDKSILMKAVKPLEEIVHDFSVEVLRAFQSAFILDQGKEVDRLKGEVGDAIRAIESSENVEAMEILKKQMQKLKSLDNVSTAAEGFVFEYDGQTYKFTGNFAPINQILGLFKYGRGNVPAMAPIKEEDDNRGLNIAILPGAFKPPHVGHLMSARYFLDKVGVDKVVVLISPKSRSSSDDSIEITADQSKKIWDIFTSRDKDIEVRIAQSVSPVKETYDFMHIMEPGDTLFLGKSEKDVEDTRFDKAQEYSDKNNLGVTVKSVLTPTIEEFGGPLSATVLRDAVAKNEPDIIFKAMPSDLPSNELENIWNILTTKQEEQNPFLSLEYLLSSLDEALKSVDESSMAAGAVAGASGKVGREKERLVSEDEVLGFAMSTPTGTSFKFKFGEKDDDIYAGLDKEEKAYLKGFLEQPGYPILTRKQKIDIINKWKVEKTQKEGRLPNFSGGGSMGAKRDEDECVKEEGLNMVNRTEFIQEMKLRKFIRRALRINEQKKKKKVEEQILEENKLRSIIKKLIKEASEDIPHQNTGINVLEDLLKKIVPVLEIDFKSLTTDESQRKSFRAHIIKATQNALAPSRIMDEPPAVNDEEGDNIVAEDELEEVDIDIQDQGEDEKFIDIDGDGIPDNEEEKDTFGIPGEDITGRNVAAKSFEKIEKNIIDSYSILDNEKDRSLFYDYLITNLKLYFDKFEDELSTSVKEPESDIYQKEKTKLDSDTNVDASVSTDQDQDLDLGL